MKPTESIPRSPQTEANAADPATGIEAASSADKQSWVDLAAFCNDEYSPGRGFIVRGIWHVISLMFFESGWFPFSGLKAWLLRRFGARIGAGLVIKPQVRIKYPWRLAVGCHCWIGQGAWIDNLADVRLGDHVCISQGVYLCTGNHDYGRRTFDLITGQIVVENGAWIGAKGIVLPGCVVAANALVAAGAVVRESVGPAEIVAGNPAHLVAHRTKPKS